MHINNIVLDLKGPRFINISHSSINLGKKDPNSTQKDL